MSFERLLLRESQILWFLNSFFPSVARVFASSLRGRIYYRNLVLIELLEIEGYILERRILNSIIITGRSLNRVEKNRSGFNQPFDPIFRLDFIRVFFFFSLSLRGNVTRTIVLNGYTRYRSRCSPQKPRSCSLHASKNASLEEG